MKKYKLLLSITFFSLICFHQVSFAQAQRFVLVEEFTQASCPSCGQQNPSFDDLLNANSDKIRSLKYQARSPGYDPMNLQNQTQVDARFFYYGITGVPTGIMDGFKWPVYVYDQYYFGAPVLCTQELIDSMYAVPSPFSMSLSWTLSSDSNSIYVTLSITALAPVSGNLKVRIAVMEKEIDFATEPGNNGETVFRDVMKRMLPSVTGTSLPAAIDSGYTTTITSYWKLANIYNLDQLAVVAFIQNDNDKSICQAAYSGIPAGVAPPETSILSAYPNPANEKATIYVGNVASPQTKLELENMLGQVIYSTTVQPHAVLTVNTSGFEPGMYIYRLVDDGKIVAREKFNVSH